LAVLVLPLPLRYREGFASSGVVTPLTGGQHVSIATSDVKVRPFPVQRARFPAAAGFRRHTPQM